MTRPSAPACIAEPVSWLRLERYHLGEIQPAERARITEHLAICPACAACGARILEDADRPLALLVTPLTTAVAKGRRRPVSVRIAAAVGALAAAAAVVLVLGRTEPPGAKPRAAFDEGHIKGDAIAFSLVRDDDERISDSAGVYRNGDRFKALVTCPPGTSAAFDVVVYDTAGASFPLEAAGEVACGNDVPLPGAFRLTGESEETVCLVWAETPGVDRTMFARGPSAASSRLCKRLRPSTRP